MNIFIASDENGRPMSLILAEDKQKAIIAFTSMKIKFDSIEEIDPNHESFRNLGVAFILNSVEKDVSMGGRLKTVRIFKRGL